MQLAHQREEVEKVGSVAFGDHFKNADLSGLDSWNVHGAIKFSQFLYALRVVALESRWYHARQPGIQVSVRTAVSRVLSTD